EIEDQEALVAPPGVDARLGLRVGAEAPDREAVGMVTQLLVPGPELAAGVVPDRVADRELLAAVAVEIHRVGRMAGLTVPLPEPLQEVVQHPEVRVAILDQELVWLSATRKI